VLTGPEALSYRRVAQIVGELASLRSLRGGDPAEMVGRLARTYPLAAAQVLAGSTAS